MVRRRKTRSLAAGLMAVILSLVALWGAGLVWFAGLIPNSVTDATTRTDAIVVLTGGRGRLEAGLDLLAGDRAERMFVSGVYRGVDVKTLLGMVRSTPADIEDRVGVGDAVNTAGNAAQTAVWVRNNELASIRLVTASYHMPRSLLEFRHSLPRTVIVPHPTFSETVKQQEWWAWPGTAALIAREYTKYLLARARHFGSGLLSPGGAA